MFGSWRICRNLSVILILTMISSVVVAQDEGSSESVAFIEYTVIADTANLRSGPGTSNALVTTLVRGDSILVYDEDAQAAGWLRVFREGENDAYIADFLVEKAPQRFYPVAQEPTIVLSGRGGTVTDVVDLPRGAYRIDAVVKDNSFILSSVVLEGNCTDQNVFNELDFDSNQLQISSLFVSQGCSIIFESDNLTGSWEIAIRDLLDEEFALEALLTIEDGSEISARGRQLSMPTILPEGIWRISVEADDNAFILTPQVLVGDCDSSTVFNELDFDTNQISAETVYRVPDGGCMIYWETNNIDRVWTVMFNSFTR